MSTPTRMSPTSPPRPGYISHRMTGQFKDTAANYAGVWPFSSDRWEWLRDDEGFSKFQVPREMLFELLMPGDVLGYVTPEASRHTGIPAGLPVVATSNDKAVEALGCGLRSSDTLLVSLGTYTASMTTGERNVPDAKSFWSNFASIPHQYLYESYGIRRGMWTVSWWRDLLGEEARAAAERQGLESSAISTSRRKRCHRLEWPHGGPRLARTDRRPVQEGLRSSASTFATIRFHIYRAILEGIALTIYRCGTAMGRETAQTYDRIVVSGGGSNSDVFMHIFADVFGIPAVRSKMNNAAGLGSAICAAVGQGLYGSWDEAIDNMVSWEARLRPRRREPRAVPGYVGRLRRHPEPDRQDLRAVLRDLRLSRCVA